jgi:glycosyltransferase involved in cell wall biosynthesis
VAAGAAAAAADSAAGDGDPSPQGPPVSILLIAYRQAATVGRAVAAALAQTYTPLEIVVSDDASDDGTYDAIVVALEGYAGPHRIVVNRNPANLGIGAHLSRLVELSSGELLFVAAGDDISLPQRCAVVVDAWLAAGRRPDLVASALYDMDDSGAMHATIRPTDLGGLATIDDWLARPPFVVGAAQAWTRRLFDRYGPLAAGVVAEDRLMVFRAIGGSSSAQGGAITLAEPLVGYGRGGVSRRVRALWAHEVVDRLLKNNRHALVEHAQLLNDAATMGRRATVEAALASQLAREHFIADLFAAPTAWRRIAITARAHKVPIGSRLRMALYALWPAAYAPFFFVKRRLGRR